MPKRKAKHLKALDLPYEHYRDLNGGDFCGICGRKPKSRRLDRDHCHKGNGTPRGLLCHRCNRNLPNWVDRKWLLGAIDYLDRSE